jgi:uroporphyrinogen decarboxylase
MRWDPSRIILKYVVDLLDRLKPLEPHNQIISPGCDMPYDTPVENVIGVLEAVRDPQGARLMLANYHAQEIDLDSVVLPDYAGWSVP